MIFTNIPFFSHNVQRLYDIDRMQQLPTGK